MKKTLIILAALCLMITAVLGVSAVSAADIAYGDLNSDGEINNRDLVMMQQYLNNWEITIDEDAADVNGDGEINNRDLVPLQQYLNNWDVTLGPDDAEGDDYFNDVELQWP